jgi:hypothetical protein
VLLVGGLGLAAEAAPRGRVVRVERNTIGPTPRFCSIGGPRGEGTCFGQPREGERIAVVDLVEKTVRGEFVIESVSEATELAALGMCVSSGIKTVKGSFTSGTGETGHVVGLRGARLNRHAARLLADVPPPSGRADESVELAVDADGNGRPDLILTQYPCDENGAPAAAGEGRCFDTYMAQHGEMQRVQQDILRSCR